MVNLVSIIRVLLVETPQNMRRFKGEDKCFLVQF